MNNTIINGMNKEELLESIEGTKLMTEALEVLLGQLEILEQGKEADNKIVRAAKLKMNEGILIFNDVKSSQEKRADIYNNKQFNNRAIRRKNGKR